MASIANFKSEAAAILMSAAHAGAEYGVNAARHIAQNKLKRMFRYANVFIIGCAMRVFEFHFSFLYAAKN
jgi:hypothetical protein